MDGDRVDGLGVRGFSRLLTSTEHRMSGHVSVFSAWPELHRYSSSTPATQIILEEGVCTSTSMSTNTSDSWNVGGKMSTCFRRGAGRFLVKNVYGPPGIAGEASSELISSRVR